MIHWLKRAASSIANAAPGKLRLWADSTDGTFKVKDENGVIKVLGNGIKSIALQSTSGLTKTYRITRDDNSIFDFSVTDGRSINTITAPATPGVAGALDTYTINYNDGTTSTFVVRNGMNGLDGQGQPATATPAAVAETGEVGTATTKYALEDHRHAHGNQTAPTMHAVATTSANGFMSSADKTKLDGIATGATAYSDELAQDAVGAGFNAGTGDGATVSYDDANNRFNVTNTDKGSAARAAHEAADDPHPQYTTAAEASAAAPVQSVAAGTGISVNATTGNVTVTNTGVTSISVNGGAAQTGAVSVTTPAPKLSATISSLFASTANSTAVQVVVSLAIPAGYLTAGKTFDFDLEGTQSQSAAATNVVGAIFVNGTQLVSAAVAGGTAAQTNRSIRMKGGIMWNGANYIGNITTGISGVLPVGNANVTGVAVAAGTAHNIDIRVQTSTANAANIIRAVAAAIKEA